VSYDLFISYSRQDNLRGRITELKERIEADYRDFAHEDLRCFFDLTEIATMDDWRHRILEGLRESNLLLLVLTPAYLESPYCEWEIVEFLKYEHSRSVGGLGVTPVYFVEIPGLDEPGFEQRAAAWVARVRRRNQVDLRPWYHEGAEALKQADVRHRLQDLEHSLHARLSKLRRMRYAPGNLSAHNPRFVGREAEMQRLHEAAGLGRFGVLTAVQGMGGVGKTALAIQYAYAYADFYPGGRWLIGCAGVTSLAAAVRRLDLDLGITLNDAEKRDDNLAARRVLAELEGRAIEGARARSGEKDPPQPKALLLLDNVDDPAMLQPPASDLFTGRQWLHLLATTRNSPEDFGHDPERLTVLSIDELPDDDALRLIESYQPGGRFPTPTERDAALALVKLLGGFTLAVEVVAVYLGERSGRVTCAAFLERMRKEGVGRFDDMIGGTKSGIRHGEKLIGATLKPTLDVLSEPERLVLSYAALLPPDSIPLPWLRALAAEQYPDLGRDAEPGYDDPWLTLVNHLLGLRLLQTIDLAEDDRTPRLLRMHRLVGELVREQDRISHAESNDLERIVSHALSRSEFLEENWFHRDSKWEIDPLVCFTELLLAKKNLLAPKLVKYVGQWHPNIGDWVRSEALHRKAIELISAKEDMDKMELAILSSNLGNLLELQGKYSEAETLLRYALEIDERLREPDHPFIAIRLNGLTQLLSSIGDYAAAEPLCRRALEARERVLGPEHPDTLTSISNLAFVLAIKGDFAGAETLDRRVMEARERVLGPEHPDTLTSISNLASSLSRKGDYSGAEPLCRRALEARERVLGPEHPATLNSINNLAFVLAIKGDFAGAEPLYRRALGASERVFGPEHPNTLTIVHNMADLMARKRDFAGAETLSRRAMEGRERVLGPGHPDTLRSIDAMSALLSRKGDFVGAEPPFRRALNVRERILGTAHPDTAQTRQKLIGLLEQTGRLDEAAKLRNER
jgi:tetratricopeptide (TPR) repeat protein